MKHKLVAVKSEEYKILSVVESLNNKLTKTLAQKLAIYEVCFLQEYLENLLSLSIIFCPPTFLHHKQLSWPRTAFKIHKKFFFNLFIPFPSTLTTGWPEVLRNSTFFKRSCHTESQNLSNEGSRHFPSVYIMDSHLNDQSLSARIVRLVSTSFSSLSQIVSSNFLRTAVLTLGEICSYSSSSRSASCSASPSLVPLYKA